MAATDRITSMNGRAQRVLLETERYRIIGTLVLPRDGYRSRLSDFLNASDRDFISLTDVSLQLLDADGRPGDPVQREFATVSRQHIVMATTDEPVTEPQD